MISGQAREVCPLVCHPAFLAPGVVATMTTTTTKTPYTRWSCARENNAAPTPTRASTSESKDPGVSNSWSGLQYAQATSFNGYQGTYGHLDSRIRVQPRFYLVRLSNHKNFGHVIKLLHFCAPRPQLTARSFFLSLKVFQWF